MTASEQVFAAGGSSAPVGDGDLIFRAITTGGERRGIRLERIFWDALGEAAELRGITLSALVAETAALMEGSNLASALRVAGTRYLRQSLAAVRLNSAPEKSFLMVNACPTPCCVLSPEQAIVSCNRPFILYVNERFQLSGSGNEAVRGLTMSLDLEPGDVLERLGRPSAEAVTTGYALGAAERSIRGEARLVMAPTSSDPLLIAFIIPMQQSAR